MYTAPLDPLDPPRCCRCRRVYRDITDMVPLVDSWGRWDERTYRNWCVLCWAKRAGAVSPADPTFFIPRDLRTRRFDKLAMGGPKNSMHEIKSQALTLLRRAPDAFTELNIPTSKMEKLMEHGNSHYSGYQLPPDTPKAEDIIAKAGQRTASKPVDPQQNPSGSDTIRGLHTCEDGVARGIPEGKLCGLCGEPYIEVA